MLLGMHIIDFYAQIIFIFRFRFLFSYIMQFSVEYNRPYLIWCEISENEMAVIFELKVDKLKGACKLMLNIVSIIKKT